LNSFIKRRLEGKPPYRKLAGKEPPLIAAALFLRSITQARKD